MSALSDLPVPPNIERIRSRLSHDLVRNRLLLSLIRLRAIMSGHVAAEDKEDELRNEISETWRTVKEDAARLIQALEAQELEMSICALPFVRNLAEQEVRVIVEMFASASDWLGRTNLVNLRHALCDADDWLKVVATASPFPLESTESKSIEGAINSVSNVARCLSALRR